MFNLANFWSGQCQGFVREELREVMEMPARGCVLLRAPQDGPPGLCLLMS